MFTINYDQEIDYKFDKSKKKNVLVLIVFDLTIKITIINYF